jgi:hypothetical protein
MPFAARRAAGCTDLQILRTAKERRPSSEERGASLVTGDGVLCVEFH